MSRQTPEGQGHEKLVANRFGVTTQGIPVATRTILLNKIYVATLSKFVATQSKSKPREQVATKRPIWASILGIHNTINEVRPNIRKLINTRF